MRGSLVHFVAIVKTFFFFLDFVDLPDLLLKLVNYPHSKFRTRYDFSLESTTWDKLLQ